MITHNDVTLRQTAELLGLDRVRLFRLGRHLHLAPGDPCIPLAVIARARGEDDEERRYRVILDWLLKHQRTYAPPAVSGLV